MNSLKGKKALVTGGASGIGRAISLELAGLGADVCVHYRSSREQAEETVDTINATGGRSFAIQADLTIEEDVKALFRRLTDEFGRLDVLVNNAGASVFKSFMDSTPQDFDQLTATNLRGPFLCTHAVLPDMLERKSGIVVMINSMAARQVFPDSSIYAATKGGLKNMTDCLRSEVRKSGIRVLSVYPGATRTEIWPERVLEKHGHKMMGPEDVAQAVINACTAAPHVLIEDIVMQPIGGGI